MTRPGLRLVVVDPLASTPDPPVDPRGGARLAFWILASLVFVCALTAAYQSQQVAQLNGQVAGLNGELTTVRTQLEAYEGRMVEIRGAVAQLQSELRELDELAQRDPLADTSR